MPASTFAREVGHRHLAARSSREVAPVLAARGTTTSLDKAALSNYRDLISPWTEIALPSPEAAGYLSVRQEECAVTDVEAGERILNILKARFTQAGEKKLKTAVAFGFESGSKTIEDFDVGLAYATREGWIHEEGRFIKLTKKGFDTYPK
jgi:hypothetical protein